MQVPQVPEYYTFFQLSRYRECVIELINSSTVCIPDKCDLDSSKSLEKIFVVCACPWTDACVNFWSRICNAQLSLQPKKKTSMSLAHWNSLQKGPYVSTGYFLSRVKQVCRLSWSKACDCQSLMSSWRQHPKGNVCCLLPWQICIPRARFSFNILLV